MRFYQTSQPGGVQKSVYVSVLDKKTLKKPKTVLKACLLLFSLALLLLVLGSTPELNLFVYDYVSEQ